MIRYWRISTPIRSANCRNDASGTALNPMMIASDASASCTSPVVIPPTAVCSTFTRTSAVLSLFSEPTMASMEPCTSALIISEITSALPASILPRMSSSVCFGTVASDASRAR